MDFMIVLRANSMILKSVVTDEPLGVGGGGWGVPFKKYKISSKEQILKKIKTGLWSPPFLKHVKTLASLIVQNGNGRGLED